MSDVFDASDEAKVNNRKRQLANEKIGDDEFIRNALKTRIGRNFFWRWLELCHIFEMSWIPGQMDSTAFREGERSIGNRILADLTRISPGDYIEMMKEHQKKASRPEKEEEDVG